MTGRLSYREFKDEFLLNFAVIAQGEIGKFINPIDAVKDIQERYSPTWVMSAAEELRDTGYLSGETFLSGGGAYALTGAGLDHAETIADARAADLYELIDEQSAMPISDDKGNTLVNEVGDRIVLDSDPLAHDGSPAIIKVDYLSHAYKDLDRELQTRIQELRGDNALIAGEGPEARQRLAELEAGKLLLSAGQAEIGLVQRLLLPSLSWFAKKVRDEGTSALIKKLIAMVETFLAGASGG
ncbi:hypothetical protein GOD74_12155 [Sinorhizobium medicae]|nr:hypothetical protein [Sinorhizobium medicae]